MWKPRKTIIKVGYKLCNLCEAEGDLFNTSTHSLFDHLSTCFNNAARVYSSPSNHTICLLVQATDGEQSWCANPVELAKFDLDCSLCSAETFLPDSKRIYNNNMMCAFAEYYAALTKLCYALQEDLLEGTGMMFANNAAKVCCLPTSTSKVTPKPMSFHIPLLSLLHPSSSHLVITVTHGK